MHIGYALLVKPVDIDSPQSVATEYLKQLSGLQDGDKNQWIGTQYSTAQTDEYRPKLLISGPHKARVASAMVNRTVLAYLAIEVVEYWFGEGKRIHAPTWLGREGWDCIYTQHGGVVNCIGVCNYLLGRNLETRY
jgi:hypothetical protein